MILTDDSSTLVVYTTDADAATCKWDTSDTTYDLMANTCTSTTNCTLTESGEAAKTVYLRCVDTAGNKAVSSYTLNYTIDATAPTVTAITSVAGDTSAPYYDLTDDSSTLVVYTTDADAATCKWDTSDTTYDLMANTCTSTTNCTLTESGEAAKTVYLRCVDTAGNKALTSYQLDYTIDATAPSVTAITSVAGDTSAPYYDLTDDSSTLVVYTTDADAATCKWDTSDTTYDLMANTCTSTTNCTLTESGEAAKTVYLRCVDTAGNKATSSWQLDYTIDATAPTAPGNLTNGGTTINSITLNFGAATTETNFDTYKIFYKQAASGVTEADTPHTDSDLGFIDYNSTTSTTVGSLSASTQYVFNIWAYDLAGQKANATEIAITTAAGNTAPNAPTLVSPSNGSTTNDDTPTLSANYSDPDSGDTGTTNYRISSTSLVDCNNNSNIVDSGTSAATATNNESTTWTPGSSIGSDATYYWCAQNDDGVLQSSWTSMGNFILDTTPPTVTAITSVAGDTSAPYYDLTDDSSTLVVYTTDADAATCKWDTSDTTYDLMANTCTSTTNCTLTESGEAAKTVYLRCVDTAGNKAVSSYTLNYTIDATAPTVTAITSVAGDTSAPYYDLTDDSSTLVVYTTDADAATCKWDTSDTTYDLMANTCTSTTNCTLTESGEAAKTVYLRCVDTAGNKAVSSYTLNYTIDATAPTVTAITSVAGDTSAPYYDLTDDSSTLVVYTTDADAATCKWDTSDTTYDLMANTCTSTTNCTLTESGEAAKTVYLRCVDTAGNKATSSWQLDYTIDAPAERDRNHQRSRRYICAIL